MSVPAPSGQAELHDALARIIELDADQRETAIAALEAGLAARVRKALARAATDGMLDRPQALLPLLHAAARSSSSGDDAAVDPRLDTRIGQFRIRSLLGEGGMAKVYLAERSDGGVIQRVALKLIRSELARGHARERFLREQRIVARLQHPGIARMIEAGIDVGGEPYLATEWVSGSSLLRWCDQRKASLRQRLQLFRQICVAVDHAHRNLIVHRDIKPANILVSDEGEPKLLDFGIARLIDDDTDSQSTRTEWRALTPDYAAPEQFTGAEITTATDIYALGVVLYELLTGQRPPRIANDGSQSTLPLPSTVVLGEAEAAVLRGSDPHTLRRRLLGDLDAIVARALRYEPAARYPSAAVFADDIQRYLEGMPVLARRGNTLYRARKLVLRHRLAATVAAVGIAVALVLGWTAANAYRERTVALARAEAVQDFMLDLFTSAAPTTAEAAELRVVDLLDRGVQQAREKFAGRPQVEGAILMAIAGVQRELSQFEQAAEAYLAAESAASRSGDRVQAATAAVLHGAVIGHRNDFAEAEARMAAGIAQLRREAPGSVLLAQALGQQADLMSRTERFDEADRMFAEALALFDAAGVDGEETFDLRGDYGILLSQSGRTDAAVQVQRRLLADATRVQGEHHSDTLYAKANLANSLQNGGKLAEAERLMSEAGEGLVTLLPAQHIDMAAFRTGLALIQRDAGRLDAAAANQLAGLEIGLAVLGEDAMENAIMRSYLGSIELRRGHLQEARDHYLVAIQTLDRVLGAGSSRSCPARATLADVYMQMGNITAAEAVLEETASAAAGADDSYCDYGLGLALGRLALRNGDPARAVELLQAALAGGVDGAEGVHNLPRSPGYVRLAEALRAAGRADEALSIYRSVIKLYDDAGLPEAPELGHAAREAAEILRSQDPAEAEALEERARRAAELQGPRHRLNATMGRSG